MWSSGSMPSATKMVGDNCCVTISLYVQTEAPPAGCWERLPIRTTLDQMELERSPNCLFQIEDKLQLTVQYQLKIIWDCESRKACVHTTVRFVTAVLAVGVSVTPPLLVNALSWATLHLAGWALGWGCWVPTTAGWRLIWLVLLGHKVTFRAPQELILIYFTEKLTWSYYRTSWLVKWC